MFVDAARLELGRTGDDVANKEEQIREANEVKVKEGDEEMKDEGVDAIVYGRNDVISDLETEIYNERCHPLVRVICGLLVKTPSSSPDTFFSLLNCLFSAGERADAPTLRKAIEKNIPTFAAKAGRRFGEGEVILRASEFTNAASVPLLVVLMETVIPLNLNQTIPTSFIEACRTIQKKLGDDDGDTDAEDDPRFLLPIMGCIPRDDLAAMLPSLIKAGNDVLLKAVEKMSERLPKLRTTYRDEATSVGEIVGMSATEQVRRGN